MFKIEEYEKIIIDFYEDLKNAPEKYSNKKLQEDKWSLKEIIGHLIDSASNNHQRFVRLQQEKYLSFPGYQQENWILIQKYNDFNWAELIELWRLYNSLLLHIIRNADNNSLGNIWLENNTETNMETLIPGYFNHLEWHINQFKERLAEIKAWEK